MMKKMMRMRRIESRVESMKETNMILFARFPLKGLEQQTTNGDAYDIYTLSAICTRMTMIK